MKITFLTIIGALFIGMTVHAQDYEALRKEINSIKKNSQYIYVDQTAETAEEAKSIAEEMLYQEINAWAAKQKKLKNSPNLVINNKKELQSVVTLPRGDMFRCFIYVKKSDIMPADNSTVLKASGAAQQGQSTVEPIQDEPAKTYPEVVNAIASYKDYYNMAEKIKQFKSEGKIEHYAIYRKLEKPEIYYLAVYNPEGKVVAVLTPGENRINVETGKPDKVTNYSGCGAIGFKVKE